MKVSKEHTAATDALCDEYLARIASLKSQLAERDRAWQGIGCRSCGGTPGKHVDSCINSAGNFGYYPGHPISTPGAGLEEGA